MSTTLIIVELLIVGCQVLVWVLLLLNRVHPALIPDKLKTHENMKTCVPLLATFVVATAYTAGVVGDRLLGHLSTIAQRQLGKTPCVSPDRANRELYMTKEIYQPHAHDYFETANRQIRLLRATSFNSIITALVLVFGYWQYCKKAWLLPILLLILGGASAWTWHMTNEMQETRQSQFYRAWQESQKGSTSAMEIRALN